MYLISLAIGGFHTGPIVEAAEQGNVGNPHELTRVDPDSSKQESGGERLGAADFRQKRSHLCHGTIHEAFYE